MSICSAWVTGDEVLDCCQAAEETVGTFGSLLDEAALVASELLFDLSGRRWAGACLLEDVRPCHGDCDCGFQVLPRGHVVDPYGVYGWSTSCSGRSCWCHDLSRVKLAGYVPDTTSIVEVLIDGVIVDPSEYRVDEHKWLTRKNGGHWPSCARADLDSTEVGTFSISYEYGRPVPFAGINAAKQLACQVFLQCSDGGDGGDCDLPAGAARITRQGITIERAFFQRNADGVWATGLTAVDYFLNAVNPNGIPRRALFISPGSRGRYARPVGP